MDNLSRNREKVGYFPSLALSIPHQWVKTYQGSFPARVADYLHHPGGVAAGCVTAGDDGQRNR
ncbi:MAG: hypothetical protein AAGF01_02130 [Cyanobacteria bacterium P01_G01_bin.38]